RGIDGDVADRLRDGRALSLGEELVADLGGPGIGGLHLGVVALRHALAVRVVKERCRRILGRGRLGAVHSVEDLLRDLVRHLAVAAAPKAEDAERARIADRRHVPCGTPALSISAASLAALSMPPSSPVNQPVSTTCLAFFQSTGLPW